MYTVLVLLRPGKLMFVLLVSELKHSKLYLSSNGYHGAIAVKLRNLVWDPGEGIFFLYTLDCFCIVLVIMRDEKGMANSVPLPICVPQVFDPGIAVIGSNSTNSLKGCACIYSSEIPRNVVFIWIGKVLIVAFDPGGGCWHCMDFDSIDINGLNQGEIAYGVIMIYTGILVHLISLANDNHNIQTSVFCKMLQSGPNDCTSILLLAGGMTKDALIPSVKMFDVVNILSSMALFTDGPWNIILLGKAPMLRVFIRGKGHGIYGYMAAWIDHLQPSLDFNGKCSQLERPLAITMELSVFIWHLDPLLISTHPWAKDVFKREGKRMVCIEVTHT